MLLIKVVILRLVWFIVEQPLTSCLWKLRVVSSVAKSAVSINGRRLCRKFVWLGHYGHAVPKPTILWGIHKCLKDLPSREPKRSGLAVPIIKTTTLKLRHLKNGTTKSVYRIYGVKSALKATQTYPRLFCDAISRSV